MPPPRELLLLLRVPMLWLDDERLGEKLRLGADMLRELLLLDEEKLLRLGIVVARVLLSRTLLRPIELRPIELLRLLPIELLRLVP